MGVMKGDTRSLDDNPYNPLHNPILYIYIAVFMSFSMFSMCFSIIKGDTGSFDYGSYGPSGMRTLGKVDLPRFQHLRHGPALGFRVAIRNGGIC